MMKKICSHIWAIVTIVILPIVSILVIGWILQWQQLRNPSFDIELVYFLYTSASICCVIFGVTLGYMMGYRLDRPRKLRGTTPFLITILFTAVSVLGIVLFFPLGMENYTHLFDIITNRPFSVFFTTYCPKALFCVYLGLIFYKTAECWFFYFKERKEIISKLEK
ncbi:MAG: hypothetical protein RR313_10035 [Anaerovoracaceae bacterium]